MRASGPPLATAQQRQQQVHRIWTGYYATWQPAAAVVIQAHWRGYWARKTLQAQRHGRLLGGRHLEDSAARVIQRFWRGYLGRLKAKEEHKAVVTIQRWWRGYRARKGWKRRLRQFRWDTEAATTIQRFVQGFLVRQQLQRAGKVAASALAREKAATVVQKCFRGMKARRRLCWLKQQQAKRQRYAATIIQRHFRQWRQRRSSGRATSVAAGCAEGDRETGVAPINEHHVKDTSPQAAGVEGCQRVGSATPAAAAAAPVAPAAVSVQDEEPSLGSVTDDLQQAVSCRSPGPEGAPAPAPAPPVSLLPAPKPVSQQSPKPPAQPRGVDGGLHPPTQPAKPSAAPAPRAVRRRLQSPLEQSQQEKLLPAAQQRPALQPSQQLAAAGATSPKDGGGSATLALSAPRAVRRRLQSSMDQSQQGELPLAPLQRLQQPQQQPATAVAVTSPVDDGLLRDQVLIDGPLISEAPDRDTGAVPNGPVVALPVGDFPTVSPSQSNTGPCHAREAKEAWPVPAPGHRPASKQQHGPRPLGPAQQSTAVQARGRLAQNLSQRPASRQLQQLSRPRPLEAEASSLKMRNSAPDASALALRTEPSTPRGLQLPAPLQRCSSDAARQATPLPKQLRNPAPLNLSSPRAPPQPPTPSPKGTALLAARQSNSLKPAARSPAQHGTSLPQAGSPATSNKAGKLVQTGGHPAELQQQRAAGPPAGEVLAPEGMTRAAGVGSFNVIHHQVMSSARTATLQGR